MNSVLAEHVKLERCILDGELVAYDECGSLSGKGGLIPFGSNRPVATAEIEARQRGEEAPRKHM
jgi:hypothetical protein